MATCDATISLETPAGSERVRGFQPPWYTVFLYTCPACGARHRVRANTFIGIRRTPSGARVPIRAVPGTGGIRCGRPIAAPPFPVSEFRAYTVHHCQEFRDQEARGLFGFHNYRACPACRVEPIGLEYWGANGHKQATLDTPADAEYIARRNWTVTRDAGAYYYQGGAA